MHVIKFNVARWLRSRRRRSSKSGYWNEPLCRHKMHQVSLESSLLSCECCDIIIVAMMHCWYKIKYRKKSKWSNEFSFINSVLHIWLKYEGFTLLRRKDSWSLTVVNWKLHTILLKIFWNWFLILMWIMNFNKFQLLGIIL